MQSQHFQKVLTMNCKICGSLTRSAFVTQVLNQYNVSFFKCNSCGYLFSEEPFWLVHAYDKNIVLQDTGILQRNLYFSKIIALILLIIGKHKSKILDFGGGFGILCRLLRDKGFDCYWHDDYETNFLARGFVDQGDNYGTTISIEVLEHLIEPNVFFDKVFQRSSALICSTTLLQSDIPNLDWHYYTFETGQHISFYSKETFSYIANKYGKYFYSFGYTHLFLDQKLNLLQQNLIRIICLMFRGRIFSKFFYKSFGVSSKMLSDSQLPKTDSND